MHDHDVHNSFACLDLIGQGHVGGLGALAPPRRAEVVVFELGLTQAVGLTSADGGFDFRANRPMSRLG